MSTGESQNFILLEELEENDAFIVPEEKCNLLLKNELQDGYVGISSLHEGIRELKQAYEEACAMRKVAFARNKVQMIYTEEKERIPEKLIAEAAKLVEPSANMQRVQLMGTERLKNWKRA